MLKNLLHIVLYHTQLYILLGVFSNTIQGIEGGIALGLGHGFVSSGLFICAGGVLYDRSGTRLISYYRGIAQIMPLFSVLFFILSLGNAWYTTYFKLCRRIHVLIWYF